MSGKKGEPELPMESSPYLKYSDMEDYKSKGYGTEGHLDPKPNQAGGASDAPTLSASAFSQTKANPSSDPQPKKMQTQH